MGQDGPVIVDHLAHDDDVVHRPRWPGGARALTGLLALTTLGAAGAAGVGFMRSVERADRIETLRSQLAERDQEVDTARAELAAATQEGVVVQESLDATATELDDLATRYARVAAGFPVTAETFLAARIDGVHALTNAPVVSSCVGFSDTSASCVADNFPTDLTITGTAAAGYQVSSSWFLPIPLVVADGAFVATGPVSDTVGNTCGGTLNPTTVDVRLVPTGLLPDEVAGGWVAAALAGSTTISSPATATCVAASRTADFVTAVG